MTGLPFAATPALVGALDEALDVEGKIPRALVALGLTPDRPSAVLDVPGTPWLDRLRAVAPAMQAIPAGAPGAGLAIPVPDGSLDAVVTLWTGFLGVDNSDLAEADRVLADGGRLLVVHDYGRDDVSRLRDPGAQEYGAWSRRDGPFLRGGGFKIRVVHCFWTFPDLDAARAALVPFGEAGAAVADGLRRPRLTWNVAVYHRGKGGAARLPVPAAPDGPAGP